jgi:hypothetical protein
MPLCLLILFTANPETRCFLLIWLFQQATIGSVEMCLARRFPKTCANSSYGFPAKRLVRRTWLPVAGQKASCVRDAGTGALTNCQG